MVQFADTEQEKRLELLRKREAEELAEILSQKYDLPYVDLSLVAINTDALRLIAEAEARDAEVAAFGKVGKRVSIAVRSPENAKTKTAIQKLQDLGYIVTLFLCSDESLRRAFDHYQDLSYAIQNQAGIFDLAGGDLEGLIAEATSVPKISNLIASTISLKRAYRTTRILQIILAGGLSTEASDIHFEPEEKAVRLRYRLDGVLLDVLSFDEETYRLVLSRLKLLSGLKLNVTESAQDGRFSIKIKGEEIEMRTSILPGNYGETMVMRILNPKTIGVPLEGLGMEEKLRIRIEKEIDKPNGMVLTTGPTGSGKTTTLYAFLRKVNSSETKIITIEDPIEYHLSGIVQTQVDKEKNYTFASGLRSALRQDPDIIMVGEIRDEEVATTAINAALTGHLVFSTLHTNDAAGSFPRLIDLGVSEKVMSSSVNVAIAQRLVRKLCPTCKKQRPANAQEEEIISRTLAGVVDKSLLPENRKIVSEASTGKCDTCGGRGYKGRVGIFEAIFMDKKIEEILRSKPSEREIFAAARAQGTPSMIEDGILKALRGVTSFEELRRVVDLDALP
ncbi:MAG: type II/IV secretion system protein [Patescibacteria group bacterium]|nr:type II/IV secretion system protein [Patescibacteria group bacterium]